MSLLTPPSTCHRNDQEKENRFSMAGPSTRSVVWAPDASNKIHNLATPPKPMTTSSKQRPRASKSILKNSNQNALLGVQADSKPREATPEPSDPLVDLHYFDHPVSQVISVTDPNSLESLAQLIEGYNVLAARIRSTVSDKTDADASWPLFQPLRKNKEAIVDAIVRDLGRALVNPLSLCSADVEEEEELLPKFALPSPKSSPAKKKAGMTAEQVKYARDLGTTCQSVIKALSAILSLPAVYMVFEEKQLRSILTAILAIPLAEELPTPNSRKTCALAIWLIQVQRLPANVLQPAADRIAYALRRGIDGELGKEGKKGSTNDGLKAIHDLSVYLPGVFVPAFQPLLSSVLSNLLANTLALRTQACHALGGFVLGLTSLPQSTLHTKAANTVAAFLTALPSPGIVSPTKTSEATICRTLRSTMSAVDPAHVAQGPVWALSVLASFVMLLGSRLCADGKVNKILSGLLSLGMGHKKSSLRGLSCLVWRCVTWSYFQPPHFVESDAESEVDDDIRQQCSEVKQVHFKVMVSVLDCQAGLNTIGALLGDDSGTSNEALKRCMIILKLMALKSGQTSMEACQAMRQMVRMANSETEEQDPWDHKHLIAKGLFSSSPGLLTAEYKSLTQSVRPLYDTLPTLVDIRYLTREELSKDFVFSGMLDCWKEALRCLELDEDAEIPEDMSKTWEGLLKANVGHLQENGNEKDISEFAETAVQFLIDIIEDIDLDLTPNPNVRGVGPNDKGTVVPDSDDMPSYVLKPTKCTDGELRLHVVHSMWVTMKTVFPHALLDDAAGRLNACLHRNDEMLLPENARLRSDSYEDTGERARNTWVSMCVDAMGLSDLELIQDFWGCLEIAAGGGPKTPGSFGWDWTPDLRNALWTAMATKWKEDELSWEGGVVLLAVPFTHRNAWTLSSEDYNLWQDLLDYVSAKALDHNIDTSVVLDRTAEYVSLFITPGCEPAGTTRLADLFLTNLDATEMRDVPLNFIEYISETMRSTYPPEPRHKQVMMWMTRALMTFIEHCPKEFCLTVLEGLRDALCLWFRDDSDSWTKDELNYDIISLYQHILVSIQALPEDIDTLERLGPILDAVFYNHVPDHAKEIFLDYWKITYAQVTMPAQGWPDSITHVLRSVDLLPPAPAGLATSPLAPAFVASSPRTPISSSFSMPPTAIIKREARSQIPSPQRPQKVIAPFPIVPTSPVSPLRARRRTTSSSSASTRGTPLSAIQLCETPSSSKRRRLNSEGAKSGKENLSGKGPVVSVAERIAEMLKTGGTPSTKKRRFEEDAEEGSPETKPTLPAPKKLKGRMKPRMTKPTLSAKPKSVRVTSPAPSAASSNESEDERWVENALQTPVPFPSMEVVGGSKDAETGVDEEEVLAVDLPKRKRSEPGPALVNIPLPAPQTQQPKRGHTTSLDAPGPKIDFRKVVRSVKRSASIPEAMLTAIASRSTRLQKRKRDDTDDMDSDVDLYDQSRSDPLPALQLALAPPPMARRSFSMPSSFLQADPAPWPDSDVTVVHASDDNVHLGQVTPGHLVSPDMSFKKGLKGLGFGVTPFPSLSSRYLSRGQTAKKMEELFGPDDGSDDSLPGSDDSIVGSDDSEESPTKELVTRQLHRKNSGLGLFKSVVVSAE